MKRARGNKIEKLLEDCFMTRCWKRIIFSRKIKKKLLKFVKEKVNTKRGQLQNMDNKKKNHKMQLVTMSKIKNNLQMAYKLRDYSRVLVVIGQGTTKKSDLFT